MQEDINGRGVLVSGRIPEPFVYKAFRAKRNNPDFCIKVRAVGWKEIIELIPCDHGHNYKSGNVTRRRGNVTKLHGHTPYALGHILRLPGHKIPIL